VPYLRFFQRPAARPVLADVCQSEQGSWFWHKREKDPPTTEVAIRRTIAEDLYIVLNSTDAATQAASFEIVVNPLVNLRGRVQCCRVAQGPRERWVRHAV